jgi:hypothetical protein
MGPKFMSICFTSHWPLLLNWFIYYEFDIRFCKAGKEKKRRINATKTIFSTIRKIQNILNLKNIETINELLEYKRIMVLQTSSK